MGEPWESGEETLRCSRCDAEGPVDKVVYAGGYQSILCIECDNDVTLKMLESDVWKNYLMACEDLEYKKGSVDFGDPPATYDEIMEAVKKEMNQRLGLFKLIRKWIKDGGK